MSFRQIFTFIPCIVLVVLLSLGCEAKTNPSVYSRGQAKKMQRVQMGEVISVRPVEIEGSKSGVGAVAGGIGGGLIGSGIGKGSGRKVATGVGIVGGAVAGAIIEEKLTHRRGLEVTVRLDNGEHISIVQGTEENLIPGDRVRIISSPDGSARAVR